MRSFRLLLSIVVATYMTGAGNLLLAQETNASPFSITLQPLQYADVKGNIGKFEALNWMKDGANAGVSDITFVKDINKNISLDVEGSAFPKTDDGTGHLTLKDGDLAFLKIDYNAFRKYYDGTGGVYPYTIITGGTNYHNIPIADQGAKPLSPDLQMDISYFKLEAGLGPITDPFLDVAYEHNSKDGDKSLLQWAPAYTGTSTSSSSYRKIAPAWESVDDTVDTVTLKENKEFAGITIKGEQKAEIDYNHNITYMQYLNDTTTVSPTAPNQLNTLNDSPDAKLFGAGIRAEKWMFNDNTYAGLGYHYNHTHATDLMQQAAYTSSSIGAVNPTIIAASTNGWNIAHASEDDHVWVGNFNTNLRPDLAFITDARYEHMGSEGNSNYYSTVTSTTTTFNTMENHQDNTGEHVSLRYSGIPHATIYGEGDFEQNRNWVSDNQSTVTIANGSSSGLISLVRLDRTQKDSWAIGGRIDPNRFFTFSTQLKQRDQTDNYDTISNTGSSVVLLNSLRIKGIEDDSTLTWKPFHWLQNSLRYQFFDTVYNPQAPSLPISENHMLTSQFTYEITVQPVDPLLLMLSYSHVENYVRTITASDPGGANNPASPYIPAFNSGDNSWLFSASYSPIENLSWTNTVCYTLSPNYVNFTNGVPLGTDFKELDLTTGLDYTYHKWFKIGPKYEHASYRDNSLAGDGNYSANIFMLTTKFSW